jgi:uncharacterized membrane protein
MGSEQAFRWTSSGGLVILGALPGGSGYSSANGVSGDGSTTVGVSNIPGSYEAFRWTGSGGMVGLGIPPGYIASEAFGISSDGSTIVGDSNGSGTTQAFRWTGSGGWVGLGYAPGMSFSSAIAVSSNGSTIVGRSGISTATVGVQEAFRWTSAGGMVGLGVLPGWRFSSATAVSADGSVILGYLSGNGPQDEGFIWDPIGGMRDLTKVMNGLGLAPGWTSLRAMGIADDDQTIVGFGLDPSGQSEGWIAVIPEPGTGLLVMAGVLGLAISGRGRAIAAG